jgi:hypothetical protein
MRTSNILKLCSLFGNIIVELQVNSKSTDLSEKHVASMFRIEESAEYETRLKAGSYLQRVISQKILLFNHIDPLTMPTSLPKQSRPTIGEGQADNH